MKNKLLLNHLYLVIVFFFLSIVMGFYGRNETARFSKEGLPVA